VSLRRCLSGIHSGIVSTIPFFRMGPTEWLIGPYPGANPTIASYNASVVNFYNATGSLARFENTNIFFYF
jgi:hypothetical protein